MEGSRTALLKWAKALHFLSQRASINAVRLAEAIQVTYKTAWSILHKIRSAISQVDIKELLYGTVRAGLAFYGRDYLHQPYIKHQQEHPLIVGASFDGFGGPEFVKIKLLSMQHMDGKLMYRSGENEFNDKHVDPLSMDFVFLKKFQMPEVPLLPQLIHEARKWINRTFHGIGPKYLQAYLDEFCFRMNRMFRHESAIDTLAAVCFARA
ncbi:transposase [Paenibacillus thermotolerans]|uniref:transposase n=1 Tax=Paenibacillus thermotolerans TaxID=3027807 RepID=UPI0023679E52|nr:MULTISPECIES: transposase [unclassified Paenibacillus]